MQGLGFRFEEHSGFAVSGKVWGLGLKVIVVSGSMVNGVE